MSEHDLRGEALSAPRALVMVICAGVPTTVHFPPDSVPRTPPVWAQQDENTLVLTIPDAGFYKLHLRHKAQLQLYVIDGMRAPQAQHDLPWLRGQTVCALEELRAAVVERLPADVDVQDPLRAAHDGGDATVELLDTEHKEFEGRLEPLGLELTWRGQTLCAVVPAAAFDDCAHFRADADQVQLQRLFRQLRNKTEELLEHALRRHVKDRLVGAIQFHADPALYLTNALGQLEPDAKKKPHQKNVKAAVLRLIENPDKDNTAAIAWLFTQGWGQPPDSWEETDVTFLYEVMNRSRLWTPEEREFVREAKQQVRDAWAHHRGATRYRADLLHALVDHTTAALDVVDGQPEAAELRAFFEQNMLFLPGRDSLEQALNVQRSVKVLTEQQCAAYRDILRAIAESSGVSRFRAAAGSGKSVLAVQIARTVGGLIVVHSDLLKKRMRAEYERVYTIDEVLSIGCTPTQTLIVDEGHHVFRDRADANVAGQHVRERAEEVWPALYEALGRPRTTLIFEDANWQGFARETCFPEAQERPLEFLQQAVRTPQRVRDLAHVFAQDCDELNVPKTHERVPKGCGIEVFLVDPTYESGARDIRTYHGKLLRFNIAEQETEQLREPYQRALQSALDSVGERAWLHTAVLLPLALGDEIEQLRPPYAPALAFFGPVEQFTGLECPFIITVGFHHPRYLLTRELGGPRVDPRMYCAVTRATCWVGVVDIKADHLVDRFLVADADTDDGMVRRSSDENTCAKLQPDGTSLVVAQDVDMAAPDPENIERAHTLQLAWRHGDRVEEWGDGLVELAAAHTHSASVEVQGDFPDGDWLTGRQMQGQGGQWEYKLTFDAGRIDITLSNMFGNNRREQHTGRYEVRPSGEVHVSLREDREQLHSMLVLHGDNTATGIIAPLDWATVRRQPDAHLQGIDFALPPADPAPIAALRLGEWRSLTSLSLGGQRLAELPTLPDALQVLDVRGNLLTALPVVGPELRELDASCNNLASLNVAAIGSTLTSLKLSGNCISRVEGCGTAAALKSLELAGNQLQEPFDVVACMPRLEYLSVVENVKLEGSWGALGDMQHLQQLIVSQCKSWSAKSLPQSLVNLHATYTRWAGKTVPALSPRTQVALLHAHPRSDLPLEPMLALCMDSLVRVEVSGFSDVPGDWPARVQRLSLSKCPGLTAVRVGPGSALRTLSLSKLWQLKSVDVSDASGLRSVKLVSCEQLRDVSWIDGAAASLTELLLINLSAGTGLCRFEQLTQLRRLVLQLQGPAEVDLSACDGLESVSVCMPRGRGGVVWLSPSPSVRVEGHVEHFDAGVNVEPCSAQHPRCTHCPNLVFWSKEELREHMDVAHTGDRDGRGGRRWADGSHDVRRR